MYKLTHTSMCIHTLAHTHTRVRIHTHTSVWIHTHIPVPLEASFKVPLEPDFDVEDRLEKLLRAVVKREVSRLAVVKSTHVREKFRASFLYSSVCINSE